MYDSILLAKINKNERGKCMNEMDLITSAHKKVDAIIKYTLDNNTKLDEALKYFNVSLTEYANAIDLLSKKKYLIKNIR